MYIKNFPVLQRLKRDEFFDEGEVIPTLCYLSVSTWNCSKSFSLIDINNLPVTSLEDIVE